MCQQCLSIILSLFKIVQKSSKHKTIGRSRSSGLPWKVINENITLRVWISIALTNNNVRVVTFCDDFFFLPGRTLSLVKFETYLSMISCTSCVILPFLPVMCANYWQLSYCSSPVHYGYVIVCIFVNKPNTILSRKCWLCKVFLSYHKICSYLLRSYVKCCNWHGSILLVYRDKRVTTKCHVLHICRK